MKNRSMFKNNGKPCYEVQNKNDVTEVFIYDEIGYFGVSAETFSKDLKSIKNDVIIRINSPGGSVFDGMAIYNAIKDFKHHTTTIVDGLAASAASYIALSGDTVKMSEGAFLMIHDPYSLVIGNADEMRKEAGILDKIRDQIAGFYVRKSGLGMKEISNMMSDETWLTCEDALSKNMIDEIIEDKPAENLFDLSVFNKVPDVLSKSFGGETPRPKDFEQALRDAGMTRREAKAVLSKGLKALEQPDEDKIWAGLKKLQLSMKG